jgi:hypothetical protein
MEFSAVTANGQPLDVMGSLRASVMVGALDIQHTFYIAGDINSDGILGLDLLSSLEALVNLKDGTLDCRGDLKVPLSKRRRDIEVACVIIQEDTTVPANHEVIFPASIDLRYNPGEYEGFVEPDSTFHRGREFWWDISWLMLQDSKYLYDYSTPLLKLYKGMHVGSFIPTQDPQLKKCSGVVATISPDLSADWAYDLIQPSALTNEQKEQVKQLLEEFKSVSFAIVN